MRKGSPPRPVQKQAVGFFASMSAAFHGFWHPISPEAIQKTAQDGESCIKRADTTLEASRKAHELSKLALSEPAANPPACGNR